MVPDLVNRGFVGKASHALKCALGATEIVTPKKVPTFSQGGGAVAEALYLTGRTREALEAIEEAETLADRFEQRTSCAELHKLRGVFLASIGADETRIEASFCEAIRIAKEQKSVSLEQRAEATFAEYRRQKAGGSGGRGFRLALC